MSRWTFTTIRDQAARSGEGAARVFTVVQSQPSWVTRIALTAAAIVVSAIVLLLVVPAVLIGAVIFLILAGGRSLIARTRGLLGLSRGGRKNVRVVVRR